MLELDRKLFLILNSDWTCPFLDRLMPLVTNQHAGIYVLLAILIAIGVLGGKKGRMTVIASVVGIAIIDILGAHVFKPLIGRLRPCHLEIGRHLVRCGSGFAMPSLHAANTFGVFTPIVWRYKWKAAPFYIISVLVSYSRIYVGVHWPADVIVGMIWGVAVGCGVSLVFFRKWSKKSEAEE